MNSPYKRYLDELVLGSKDVKVSIDRADTDSLEGTIEEITEDGCIIIVKGDEQERVTSIFVAYEDIRGIGYEDWDYDEIIDHQ
jgi:uncharacterized membrane protein